MQTLTALLVGGAIAAMAATYGAHLDCANYNELNTPFADYTCTPKHIPKEERS